MYVFATFGAHLLFKGPLLSMWALRAVPSLVFVETRSVELLFTPLASSSELKFGFWTACTAFTTPTRRRWTPLHFLIPLDAS